MEFEKHEEILVTTIIKLHKRLQSQIEIVILLKLLRINDLFVFHRKMIQRNG